MGSGELSVLKTEILNAIRATDPRKQRIKPGKFTKDIGRETVPYMSWKDHTPLTVVPQKIANQRPAGDLT